MKCDNNNNSHMAQRMSPGPARHTPREFGRARPVLEGGKGGGRGEFGIKGAERGGVQRCMYIGRHALFFSTYIATLVGSFSTTRFFNMFHATRPHPAFWHMPALRAAQAVVELARSRLQVMTRKLVAISFVWQRRQTTHIEL